jgi:hypothetical protein
MSHTTYPASPQRRQGAQTTSRRRLAPALLACASLLGATPAFAVDWQTPQYGDDRIDVQNYNLALEIQPSLTAISGVVTMQVRPTVATRDFTLDLHALKVSNVTVGGLKAAYTQTNNKLRITPTTGLRQNQVVTVQVTYAGSPSGVVDDLPPEYGGPSQVWRVNQARRTLHFGDPNSLSCNVFPCNQVSTDKAAFNFAITVPKGLVAVAPGLPQPAKPAGIGKATYSFALSQEIAPQDVSLNVGPFRVDTATLASGLRLDLYTMADVTDAPAAMATFRRVMESSERLWGTYRFPSCSAIASAQTGDIDPSWYWRMKANVSWTNLATDEFATFEQNLEQNLSKQFLVSNPARLGDGWFGDGLENYALYQISETDDLDDFIGDFLYTWTSLIGGRWGYPIKDGRPVMPSLLDPDYVLRLKFKYSYIAYHRGNLMMADLEYRVGRPMVNKILRSWVALQRTRPVTTTDFVTNAALVSKDPGVVNLLNNWIYTDPLPTPAFVTEAASGN